MSISVEVKMTGDITTPEHQAAIKSIMDAVEKAASELPGIGNLGKPYRFETKTKMVSRPLLVNGFVDPEPFGETSGFMHEARMQFGFHLNPVAKTPEPAADCPDNQD